MADLIETLIGRLTSDATLMGLASDVGYLIVEQQTVPPYVLLSEAADRPEYGLNDQLTHRVQYLDIEVVADLVGSASGYTTCETVLDRIYLLLQNREDEVVSEEGVTICLRRGKRLPPRIVTQSGGEQYLRRGHEWEVVISAS